MIRERGEPAIADTSKPLLEAPVVPNFPENTQPKRKPADDPDLVGNKKKEDVADEEDSNLD